MRPPDSGFSDPSFSNSRVSQPGAPEIKRMSSCSASGASRSIFSSQSVMKVSDCGGKYQRRIHHGTFLAAMPLMSPL